MANPGVTTLASLTDRVKKLESSKDPDEAKALREWMNTGGWDSVKATLNAYFESIIHAPTTKTYTIGVRLFTQWDRQPFQVTSYNTKGDFRKVLAEYYSSHFGREMPLEAFDVKFAGASYARDTEVMGEILKRFDEPSNIIEEAGSQKYKIEPTAVILPWVPVGTNVFERKSITWFQDAKGEFTAPVELHYRNGIDKQLLFPLNEKTTIGQFQAWLRKTVPGFRSGLFTNWKGQPVRSQDSFYKDWDTQDFRPITIYEKIPVSERIVAPINLDISKVRIASPLDPV